MRDEQRRRIKESFKDKEARYAFVENFLNASVAAQIKRLREARDMSQEKLAEEIGTKQSGISRLENVNYDCWKVETLRKLARAYGVRLRISFEEFGTLVHEIERFRREPAPRKYEDDPFFKASLRPSHIEAHTSGTNQSFLLSHRHYMTFSGAGDSSTYCPPVPWKQPIENFEYKNIPEVTTKSDPREVKRYGR
jgi:transcriptional regulator with XRE-family HTH domain